MPVTSCRALRSKAPPAFSTALAPAATAGHGQVCGAAQSPWGTGWGAVTKGSLWGTPETDGVPDPVQCPPLENENWNNLTYIQNSCFFSSSFPYRENQSRKRIMSYCLEMTDLPNKKSQLTAPVQTTLAAGSTELSQVTVKLPRPQVWDQLCLISNTEILQVSREMGSHHLSGEWSQMQSQRDIPLCHIQYFL